VLSLSTKLATTACEQYNTDNLVCPSNLRGDLFSVAKRSCTLELLPPTSDAFMLRFKRAVYQAVFIWGQSFATKPKMYNTCLWSCTNTADRCLSMWMTIYQKCPCFSVNLFIANVRNGVQVDAASVLKKI